MYWLLVALFVVNVPWLNAGSSPAFKPNTEYTYNVNGRTLSGLDDISNQYSGILLKAKLKLTALPDGQTLQGQITNTQTAPVHAELHDGWKSQIPESQLNFKRLELTDKPFQLTLKNGLIKDIILEKDTLNWEANMIKSIVSQLQLDVAGQKVIEHPLNSLPKGDKLGGNFRTMEETVTGKTDTLYNIQEYPQYLLQSESWLKPKNMGGDFNNVYEVIKTKNYTNSLERPSYHFGFGDVKDDEPTGNKLGSFWTRHSESRAILTGKLSKFTVHSTVTCNQISVNPNLNYKGKGSVISVMNLTLSEVNSVDELPQGLSNPVNIGNLVYIYTSNNNNKIPQGKMPKLTSAESNEESLGGNSQGGKGWGQNDVFDNGSEEFGTQKRNSGENEESNRNGGNRLSQLINKWGNEDSSEETIEAQPLPAMKDAPNCPLLPNLIYSKSLSLKEHKNNVLKLALEIGDELDDPKKLLKEHTMEKFVLLGALLRLLGEKEMKELSQELYTESSNGKELFAWMAFRDGVADAGTGPAFLLIEKWIDEGKLKELEAALAISDLAVSTTVPTVEYMKKFFELIKKPKVKNQAQLNESAVLAFTNLAHRVYVNKIESHNQFPTHTFGSFNTKEGRQLLKESIIPWLTQQLNNAITEGNSRKIHLYIAALHNIGHRNILQAFEPYLEGTLKASQFQRLLMVAALNRLTTSDPLVALSVLYKIYQNVGELPEIRSLAVALIIKTKPQAEILQNIAATTHLEKQEQVRVAVMSALETASRLKLPQNEQLRAAAESALPLLKLETYGSEKSYIDVRDFLVTEMENTAHHEYSQLGSEDSYWPKVISFQSERNDKGYINHYFSLKTFMSSVEELESLFKKLMSGDKKPLNTQQSGDAKWSSPNVAKMMGYDMLEKEQLEVMVLRQFGNSQTFWSFNNRSIEQLPEDIRKLEEEYGNGKEVQYVKMQKLQDMVLSVPTEMGLPFVFTYDLPVLVRYVGSVQVEASPRMSSKGKLNNPNTLTLQADGDLTFGLQTQGRMSFITPYDHEVYTAGFTKIFNAQKPLSVKVEINTKLEQTTVELNLKPTNGIPLIHYGTWPYTSKWELTGITPLLKRQETQIIHGDSRRHRNFNIKFGKKEAGIALSLSGHHLTQSGNIVELFELAQTQGYMALWHRLWDRSALSQSEIQLKSDVEQSTTKKIVFKYIQQSQYTQEPKQAEKADLLSFNELKEKLAQRNNKGNQELLDHITSGINNADGNLYDATLEFQGDDNIKYNLGLATAKSNVDPRVRVLGYLKGNGEDGKQLSFEITGKLKNTNALDLSSSMKNLEDGKFQVKCLGGEDQDGAASITGEVLLKRSESRKRYLMEEHPLYGVCKKQMQEGNYQLAACQNLTIAANFYDTIESNFKCSKISRKYADIAEGLFKGLRLFYYTNVNVDEIEPMGENIEVKVKFAPEEFRSFNFSVAAGDENTLMYNMSIDDHVLKAILVPHPVFHLKSRLIGVLKGWRNIRPTCVIDQNIAQTFSNRTYPISLTDKWTVAVQYVPQMARSDEEILSVEDQLLEQSENYVVLLRQLPKKMKELLLTFNTPQTDGQTNTIKLTPKGGSSGSSQLNLVPTVNDEELSPLNHKKSQDLLDGQVQMYALPNGEVKVEIRGVFYLTFDGRRVKFTATSGKLRNANRGLCGRFNYDSNEDLATPNNCIVQDSQQFVESYTLNPQNKRSSSLKYKNDECIIKSLPLYADVVSDGAAGRLSKGQSGSGNQQNGRGIQLRNTYVDTNGELCFTIRPVPKCNKRALKVKNQLVGVHCIQRSKTAIYLKNQIDKGGNPDFSKKSETKKITLEVPTECTN